MAVAAAAAAAVVVVVVVVVIAVVVVAVTAAVVGRSKPITVLLNVLQVYIHGLKFTPFD